MGYQVRLAVHAEKDLQDIIAFIARDNPEAARKVAQDIRDRLHLLETFPMSGHPATDFRERTLREIVYSHYRMIYEMDADGEHINVIRIWHGARGRPRLPRPKDRP